MNRFDKQTLGEAGVIYITTFDWRENLDVWKITALVDTQFDMIVNELSSSSDVLYLTPVILKAGVSIYGKFTTIGLLSGAVAAYKSDKL